MITAGVDENILRGWSLEKINWATGELTKLQAEQARADMHNQRAAMASIMSGDAGTTLYKERLKELEDTINGTTKDVNPRLTTAARWAANLVAMGATERK